jgi:hypothetical protein
VDEAGLGHLQRTKQLVSRSDSPDAGLRRDRAGSPREGSFWNLPRDSWVGRVGGGSSGLQGSVTMGPATPGEGRTRAGRGCLAGTQWGGPGGPESGRSHPLRGAGAAL